MPFTAHTIKLAKWKLFAFDVDTAEFGSAAAVDRLIQLFDRLEQNIIRMMMDLTEVERARVGFNQVRQLSLSQFEGLCCCCHVL